MSNTTRSATTTTATETAWLALSRLLKSIHSRPVVWLLSIWLAGWALFAWHIVHPSSWEAVWDTLHHAVRPSLAGSNAQSVYSWLRRIVEWGEVGMYASTTLLALYMGCALSVWWRYRYRWLPAVREARLRSGCVLEVIVPTGSKADARAASDMLGQLWNLLSSMSRGTSSQAYMKILRMGDVEAERLALSLEMWSTPHNDGKVGFYVWCPAFGGHAQGKGEGGHERYQRLAEEVRHLIMAHYPRCRVRWVEDPLEEALTALAEAAKASEAPSLAETATAHGSSGAAGLAGGTIHWCELSLLADSRYPIGSGASDERLSVGNRSANRAGSPGAGSDPLAAVIGMLGLDDEVPVLGVQIVAAAHAETAGQTQQAVAQELARLRDLDLQTGRAGKKALGPQHEARVLALEEKADRQGYDVAVRLVAVENAPMSRPIGIKSRADARLTSLLRVFTQYDRATAGVTQGFRVARRGEATLSPLDSIDTFRNGSGNDGWLGLAAPVLGRWPREGVCLPRMLPFMRRGKPCLLNMAELSAIYHFPHQGFEGIRTLRWGNYRQIPAPAFAHVKPAQLAAGERVVLGVLDDDLRPANAPLLDVGPGAAALPPTISRAGGTLPPRELGVGTNAEDLRRGTYVLGPMGSGKSVFLYNMIVQYMSAGRGVGLIDGKGDSYEEVLQLVPPHLEGEVLAFDPENRRRGANGPAGRSIGINPLDGQLVARFGAEKVESLTMGLMRKMMGASWDQAVLMQRFLRDALLAVLEAEPSPTMLNLWRWLQDDGKGGNEYRAAMLSRVRNQLVKDFWRTQVASMSSQQRSSMQNVLTRVDRYIKNDVRHVILQRYSTVNFREVMDRGTIFVGRVSPRLGEDQAFLGALLLNGFLTGAFARQEIPQEQRRDYLLVVDEFQNFVDTARTDVERMLSMARGYRLDLMLAHQFTEQLPREVLSAILKNVQTWVLFGLQADDARLFAGYMGLKADDFQSLPPYHSYQRTIVGNKQTGAYSSRPLPLPLPADNPGRRFPGGMEQAHYLERDSAHDLLRAAHLPDQITKLVRGAVGESQEARRARVLKLAGALYWPAEEGDETAVQVLSLLTSNDLELYRRARSRLLDRRERERILARPWLVPGKAARIERLSALRWGTPCVEVEALIRAMLRKAEDGIEGTDEGHDIDGGDGGHTQGFYGPPPA